MIDYGDNYKERLKQRLQNSLEQEKKSFLGFFIKNFRFTYLILIAILFFGFFALATLPKEANPEVKVPFAVVTTIYPGASPTDVEELVTDKIEDEIKNLDNLKNFNSSSGLGVSSIFVEFEAEADLQDSFQKLRDVVDEARPSLPDIVEDPTVTEISFNDFAIVTYSLVGNLDNRELKNIADNLKTELESIADVSRVKIIGGLEREWSVVVDQSKLLNFGVSLGQVVGAISASNVNFPIGSVEVDGFQYTLRVENRFDLSQDLQGVVVDTKNDTPIYLRDIAEITDGFKDKKTESRIGFPDKDPANTVSLQIYKKTGGNILNIVENCQTKIDELRQGGILPATIRIQTTNDNSSFIREDINRLSASGLQTMILIVIILLTVLGWRASLITGLSVPIAFLMAFIGLMLQGSTINSIVLFSLVLSLGLMVDNAIIVMEGINEYMKKHNKSPLEAALLSVANYKWPIVSGTLTTVAAFAPMLLVSGIMGQYISALPKTITATLISSLFVALIVLPTIASRVIKEHARKHYEEVHHKEHWLTHLMKNVRQKYAGFLRKILPKKKTRRTAILIAWLLFLVSASLPIVGAVKIEMFPAVDVDYFLINIKAPVGTVLEDTKKIATQVEKIVSSIPELDNYVTNIGASASTGMAGDTGSAGSHLAGIIVNLVPKDVRDRQSFVITKSIRNQLESIQGAEVKVEELSAGPPTGAPIEVRIYGDDMNKLASVSSQLKRILASIDNVINIKDNLDYGAGEFVFKIDRQRASYYGLDVISIASTLRNAIYGTTASLVNINGDDVDVVVKYDSDKLTSVDSLGNILLLTPQGGSVPVKQVADIGIESSLLRIAHRDGEKVVLVTADLETGSDLRKVLSEFDAQSKNLILPANVTIDVGGEVEDIEQSYTEIFSSMILAIILIAFILVLQFNSFRQPFIILFTLPLAVIGVIFGLLVTRLSFGLPVFIGVVGLVGIVVNDAIILIDKINKNIRAGMFLTDAIIDGGISRMQPIFLTSATTIAGIFPLLFADELWRGLSVAVIFGLIFSTLLTLIMVPITYASVCQKEGRH